MNLITSGLFPFSTPDRGAAWFSAADLLSGRKPDGTFLGLPDPLLDEALIELLAAILWLAGRPNDEAEWRQVWRDGYLKDGEARVQALAPYFEVFGETRAFQDISIAADSKWEENPVAQLFHAAPGDQTTKRNRDIGPAGPVALNPAVAAIALYAMQAHAHGRGAGFRTSVAGGGPLRTVPRVGDSLFRRAWAMVMPRSSFERGMDSRQALLPDAAALPWVMNPGSSPLAGTSHPLLVLFATPRRILLSPPKITGCCDLTGIVGPVVTHLREATLGPAFSAGGFIHPWTPWREETGKPALPVLAVSRSTTFGWRDWAGFVTARRKKDDLAIVPAAAISEWTRKRLDSVIGRRSALSISAYGVRCANAKVLGFVKSTYAFDLVDEGYASLFADAMQTAVTAVERIGEWLTIAIRQVINDGSQKRIDVIEREVHGHSDILWVALEEPGRRFCKATSEATEVDDQMSLARAKSELHKAACGAAIAAFDAATADAILQPDIALVAANARGTLIRNLWGRPGRDLFKLAEPVSKPASPRETTDE